MKTNVFVEEREALAAVAFFGAGAVPLVGKKVVDGREQKRAEAALFAAHATQGIEPQEAGKEFLGQVLGIRRRKSLAASLE